MGKSARLRLSDVRAVGRIVGECRELGYDARSWGLHLLEGVTALVGIRSSMHGEMSGFREQPTVISACDLGWTAETRGHFTRWIRDGRMLRDPLFHDHMARKGMRITSARHQVTDRSRWHSSPEFQEYTRLADSDDTIASTIVLPRLGIAMSLNVNRGVNEPSFSPRDVRIVDLLQRELTPLVGTALATSADPPISSLSLRLRQTLDGLLEGDSEKQLARRLGVATATIHQYVKHLYKHFGVASRAELMAYFLRRARSGSVGNGRPFAPPP